MSPPERRSELTPSDDMTDVDPPSAFSADGTILSALSVEALGHARDIEALDRRLGDGPAVSVLRWPEQREALEELRRQHRPRLALLEPHTVPFIANDSLEDWIRLPASVVDLRTRLLRLRRDAERRPPRPVLGGDGRLLYRERWVGLSPRLERIATALAASFGEPVKIRALIDARDGSPASIDGLRSALHQLRRVLRPLDLEIVTVHNHGYALRATDPSATSAAAAAGAVRSARVHPVATMGDAVDPQPQGPQPRP